MATMAPPADSSYPVRFDVAYPENLSRGLIFIKWLLAIPHFVIIYALNIVFEVLTFIAFFAILFTTKYPEGLFKFNVGIRRWQANVTAYLMLMRDEYPPFSFDPGQYPVTLEIDYPENLKRFAPLYKWLLAIPHLIVLGVLGIVAFLGIFVAWFAILFTGKFPKGIFDFVVGVQRWNTRVTAYVLFMRDEYPPFSLK
jgi:hypothetical protein